MLGGAGIGLSAIALPVAALALTTLLGGMFKGSRPHPAATVGLQGFTAEGGLKGIDLQAKHLSKEDAKKFADSLGTITGAVAAASGIDFSAFTGPAGGTAFQAGVNDGQGFFTFGSHKSDLNNTRASVKFDPKDEADMQRAMGDLAKLFVTHAHDIGQEVNATLLATLDAIETKGRTAEEVIADIAFAAGFDEMGKIQEEASEVKKAFDEIKRVFGEAAATAERLGLEVQKVRDFEESRLEMFRRSVAQGTAMDVLRLVDPAGAASLEETERYRRQLQDLKAIGASQQYINQATLLHQLRLEQINQQQGTALDIEQERLRVATDVQRRFASVEVSFKKFLSELEFGRFTADTPVANLNAMRGRIGSLSGRAALGDIEAQEELAELLPAFLELSGEVNGYNADFARDRQLAQQVAENTLSVAERQINLQQIAIDKAQQQIDATQTGFANLAQQMAALGITMGGLKSAAIGAPVMGGTNAAGRSLDEAIDIAGTNKRLTVGQIENLGRQMLGGYTGPSGSNEINNLMQQRGMVDTYNAAIRDLANSQGFATGGLVTGESGHDRIPARLSNNEFVMRAQAVQKIGVANLAAMNATGSVPANGNVTQKLDALITATMAVGRAVAESGNIQASKQQAVVDALDGIKRTQQVAALA
jgi:hypothetical protein